MVATEENSIYPWVKEALKRASAAAYFRTVRLLVAMMPQSSKDILVPASSMTFQFGTSKSQF